MRLFRWLFKSKPLSEMDIYEIAESHRKRFLEGEAKAVGRITSVYKEVEKNLKKALADLEAKIAAYYASGGEPGEIMVSWLNQQERYKALIEQIDEQLATFADKAQGIALDVQSASIQQGAADSGASIKAQLEGAGVTGSFNLLHKAAFEEIGHTLSNGSPLYDLFKAIAPDAVAKARGVLGQAAIEGWNPRKTGKALREGLGVSQYRATLIARTESIRAYRLATQRQMQANSDVVTGWVWYASHTTFTCPVCLAMDGSVHDVGDIMNSHPACRCTMVPLVKSFGDVITEGEAQEPGLDGSLVGLPTRQTGSDWFANLAAPTQRGMLGPGKFDLYSEGKINLNDLVEDTYDDRWGPGKKERSLKSLRQMIDAGTTDVLLGAQKAAEAAAKKDAILAAKAQQIADKLAKIEAKKKYEAEKKAAQEKLAAEEAKAAKVKEANEGALAFAEKEAKAYASLDDADKTDELWTSPGSLIVNHLDVLYPENTLTLSDIEGIYKKHGAYSPDETKAYAERKVAKDTQAAHIELNDDLEDMLSGGWYLKPETWLQFMKLNHPKASLTLDEVKAAYKKHGVYSQEEQEAYKQRLEAKKAAALQLLQDEHTIKAQQFVDAKLKAHAQADFYQSPSQIINTLDTAYPHHQISEAAIEAAQKAHGILSPQEKAEQAAKATENMKKTFIGAATHAPEGKVWSEDEWKKIHQGLMAAYPKSTLTLEDLKTLWEAHAPPPPQAVTKDLGYPGEHLLKDGKELPSIDAYAKYLVKEVGQFWTPKMILDKMKVEFPGQKLGWNAAGIKGVAKKLGIAMPEKPMPASGAAPQVAEPVVAPAWKPPTPEKLESWKLDPESVVLGGTKTGAQAGSNPGGFYKGTDGNNYYVKFYTDAAQAYNEHLANSIYRGLGIESADTTVFTDSKGQTIYVSKIIENEGTLGNGYSKVIADRVLDGFAADVFLANWDVVGMSSDNIVRLAGGDVARIDNGGSLLYRAKAGRKPIDRLEKLGEWEIFASPSNPSYHSVFKKAGISDADELGKRAVEQIDAIKAYSKAVGGWRKYVDETVPNMSQADRDTLVRVLDRRESLLTSKRKEILDAANFQAYKKGGPTRQFDYDDIVKIEKKLGGSSKDTGWWLNGAFGGNSSLFSQVKDYLTSWTKKYANSDLPFLSKSLDPNTSFGKAVNAAKATHQERWENLAESLKLDAAPDSWVLYRGTSGHDMVRWAAAAWADNDSEYMKVLMHELASFSPIESSARGFYGQTGVLYKADVPMSMIAFDKWVDDGSLYSGYFGENEVIAAAPAKNAIACRKSDIKIRYEGVEYTFDQRDRLFEAIKRRGHTVPSMADLKNEFGDTPAVAAL